MAMFAALFRSRRLPADKRPPLDRDERIVAWALPLIVTNLGVWLPDGPSRLGWHEIHKAAWTGTELSLVAASVVSSFPDYDVVVDLPPVSFLLDDPDGVPDQVRTRVNRSIAYSAHHVLPTGGGVRVVARRVPGVNGLRWTVRYDGGPVPEPDPDTAALVAAAKAAIAGTGPG